MGPLLPPVGINHVEVQKMNWKNLLVLQPDQRAVKNPRALDRKTLERIIAEVRADPLAGHGCFSAEELLIDRIIAHVKTSVAPVDPPLDLQGEQISK